VKSRFCPRHPARRARRRCFRCGTRVCHACSVRLGFHHFCDTGCSVIHAWQRAVEAEWQIHGWTIRDVPIPPRVQRRLGRWRRVLDAQRVVLRTPASAARLSPVLRLGWALLVFIPLLVVAYQYRGDLLSSLSPASRPRTISSRAIPPVVSPVRIVPPKPSGLIPPRIAKLPPLPPETNLSRGPTWERKVALTFDGGAEANVSDEILDTLKSMGIKATIFVTGRYIARYPDLLRRMIRDGHEIGNHTFSHPRLTTFALNRRQDTRPGVTREFVQGELRRAARLFEDVTGVPISPYWRAPYGEHNEEIRRWAAEIGYLHVGWTRDLEAGEDLDSRDWVADPRSPIYYRAEEVRDRILNFGKGSAARANGGIILLHLGTQRRQDRVDGELPAIIDGLRTQGYEFVPVSELHRALALDEGRRGSAVAAER
jgi:peptidoglycan/xylan/chitin deacetylase (PgdA/CDA1 family)